MVVFTPFAVTHPNILPSHRSSKLHSSPSQQMEMLPYRSVVPKRIRENRRPIFSEKYQRAGFEPARTGFAGLRLQPLSHLWINFLFETTEPTISVLCLAPIHLRRILPRPRGGIE